MASNTREAIIQISARISQLRESQAKTREHLKQLEADLDKLLKNEAPTSQGGMATFSGQLIAEREADGTLNHRIMEFLDGDPNRDFTAEEISSALSYQHVPSIRTALARLAEDRIRRSGRGRYQSLKGMLTTIAEAS